MAKGNNDFEYAIKKKRKNMKTKKIIFISLLILISITAIFIIISNYYKKINSIRYDKYEFYQYFSGAKVNYEGVLAIEYNNNVTKIESKDKKINTGFIPIYFQKVDNEVILPVTMELVIPKLRNKSYKVKYLTKLINESIDSEEMIFIESNNKKVYLEQSFLYNGEDLYFFPYSTTVIIENKEYKLSPLSYIIVNYKGLIEIYNKNEDKYIMIDEHEDDVIAIIGNFKVNLSTDMIMYENENKLLIKNVDKLPLFN